MDGKKPALSVLSDADLNCRTSVHRSEATSTLSRCGKPCVCIVGVGYVGKSLLEIFSTEYDMIGYDISAERISDLGKQFNGPGTKLTTDSTVLSKATHFLIAVPKPLYEDFSVNLEYVRSAINTVVAVAKPGSVIILESSVPVGTTRKLLGSYKNTFSCRMSPERIDPGRISPTAAEIPKIISALTPKALQSIYALYSTAFKIVVAVSKPEVAEMTKLYENCFRMVNIAYINEISDACVSHGVDPQEMIRAAATKPFGFLPFYPGVGVGGHCIPVNPWYLLQNNKHLPLLQLATELMLDRLSELAQQFYSDCIRNMTNVPRILIVGLGFKEGHSSLNGSPAVTFSKTLHQLGCAEMMYFDPSVPNEEINWMKKLHDEHWYTSYIDSTFDAVALCNRKEDIDVRVLDDLQNTYVRKYV